MSISDLGLVMVFILVIYYFYRFVKYFIKELKEADEQVYYYKRELRYALKIALNEVKDINIVLDYKKSKRKQLEELDKWFEEEQNARLNK